MRKFLILSFIAFMAFSCSRSGSAPVDDANATIIGFSSEKCACCWGYKIVLDDPVFIPAMYVTPEYFIAETLPGPVAIRSDSDFPMRVKIKYSIDRGNCPYKRIYVSSLEIP